MYAYNYDVIFISYDEPNADENWEHLTDLVQHAKRVHAIKGIDAAHKAAAELATTDHFFVIDGDTKVDKWFFRQTLENLNPNYVYSWSARNVVNGLVYGNGGAKLWPRHIMLNMKSHETNGGTDFCWMVPYYQMDAISSTTYINATPYQAFRTGFREGVRMSLDNGKPVKNPRTGVWVENYYRLLTWVNVGTDVKNGSWATLGASVGCYEVCLGGLDVALISDYDWMEQMWNNKWSSLTPHDEKNYKYMLRYKLRMPVTMLDKDASAFAREIVHNPVRSGLMLPDLGSDEYLKKMGWFKE